MTADALAPALLRAIADRLAGRLGIPVELASLGGIDAPPAILIRHGGVAHLFAPQSAASADDRDPAAPDASAAAGRPAVIVVANELPAATRAELRQRGTAHADAAGAAWLRLPGLLVDLDPASDGSAPRRRGRPRQSGDRAATASRPLVNPFSDASGLVLRALLRDPDRTWSQKELTEATELSVGHVSDTIKSLSALHHVFESGGKRGKSIRLANPARLLLDWARKVDRPGPASHVFYMDAPLDAREALLVDAFDTPDLAGRWALTLHAAGRHLAPHVVQDRLHAYVAADRIDAATARLEDEFFLARVPADRPDQGNIHLLAPHDARGTFVDATMIDGVPVVSPVQLFLDLVHWPLRGSEGASALIRGRLGEQLHLDPDARRALLAHVA